MTRATLSAVFVSAGRVQSKVEIGIVWVNRITEIEISCSQTGFAASS